MSLRPRSWLLAVLCFGLACGPGYRVVEGDLSEPGRTSYVVLWGVDPGAPASPPLPCEERGVVAVPTCGEKCFPYGSLREAARRLRGNGVVDLHRVEEEIQGTVVDCRFETPAGATGGRPG